MRLMREAASVAVPAQ